MYRTISRASGITGTADRCLQNLFKAVGILAVLSLFALVLGPVATGQSIGVSPAHSHVFLTSEAATAHNHANDEASEVESEVVNVGSQSADSAPGTIHLNTVTLSSDIARLVTTFHTGRPDPEYTDPYSVLPDLPPRLS